MSTLRPIVISLAGFDPTSGAGFTADIKTFENHCVYGMAVLTANTIQTEESFVTIRWEDRVYISQQLTCLFQHYTVAAVKIGIIPCIEDLLIYVNLIKQLSPKTPIIWDPVLKSSSDFDFTTIDPAKVYQEILSKITLITPNYLEVHQFVHNQSDAIQKAQYLSKYCAVLLKGGHNSNALGFDYFIDNEKITTLSPSTLSDYPKHGSGCILSSAITANIAKGNSLIESIKKAKTYIESYLNSNHTLLGYHVR
ncbi:MAG: hydroxymethylpyrimidine/phosphomethylpyrimidine kinase [Flavobacteriaceae bacterium]|jgi:hydroxymethylpyrimidine/phosphomethylpyrimidine kinase|nr:hydroxymethylpyrimidine/phosphomethylpyrimidine kinase [Flavobacteriaceae bacterium]